MKKYESFISPYFLKSTKKAPIKFYKTILLLKSDNNMSKEALNKIQQLHQGQQKISRNCLVSISAAKERIQLNLINKIKKKEKL